jgi:hypothetical protein
MHISNQKLTSTIIRPIARNDFTTLSLLDGKAELELGRLARLAMLFYSCRHANDACGLHVSMWLCGVAAARSAD